MHYRKILLFGPGVDPIKICNIFTSRKINMIMEEENENIIVFPDNGAYKRFKSKFQKFSQVICEKNALVKIE